MARGTIEALERRVHELEARLGGVVDSGASLPGVWEVTAASGGTCTVKRRFDNDNLIDATERAGVVYESEPSIGDSGILSRTGDGKLFFLPRGGGPPGGAPRMVIAKADMVADNTLYSCKYLDSDGTQGSTITCKRPYNTFVSINMVGFLAQDSGGVNVFQPAQVVHVRTTDPASPPKGTLWIR